MKLFFSYLRCNLRLLAMLLLFWAVFAAILLLYRTPLEGALYGLLLCLALGGCFLIAGFLRYRRRHRALRRALARLREGPPILPEAADALESDYQDMLAALEEDRRRILVQTNQERDRAETFYTAWVHQIKTPLAAMGLLLQSGAPDASLLKGELFLMAAVLIIYYKQISEGYEDARSFVIMQQVGMNHKEVRDSIQSQISTVFFLPLAAAACHTAGAFPMTKNILLLFGLSNTSLFGLCSAATLLVFAVVYYLIYQLTAREYYRIVKR